MSKASLNTPTQNMGIESLMLDYIIAGRKTVEGRLNKGKFAKYKIGDIVSLRRDWRGEQGTLNDGENDVARIKILAIRKYDNFLELVEAEGPKNVIPNSYSAQAAADEYNKFYSKQDQKEFGVLAIVFSLIR